MKRARDVQTAVSKPENDSCCKEVTGNLVGMKRRLCNKMAGVVARWGWGATIYMS